MSDQLPANLSAQAYLISTLPPLLHQQGILWYLNNNRLTETAQNLLNLFSQPQQIKFNILVWPINFTDWQIKQQLKQPYILLLPAEYLKLNLPSPQQLKKHTIKLSVGLTIKPYQVLNQLIQAGFEPGPLIDQSGWFVKQGGNLQIASSTGHWLINWSGDQIESLWAFNPHTGQQSKQLNELAIWPHRLTPDRQINLIDYLSGQENLVAGPVNLKLGSGQHWPVNPLATSRRFKTPPRFGRQWNLLKSYLLEQTSAGYSVFILSSQTNTINQQLFSHNLIPPAISVEEVSLETTAAAEGFIDQFGKKIYLTDREILGLSQTPRRVSLTAYDKLQPGDYLVHIDHGIGRFVGLTKQTVDNIEHDYFLLTYADNDKLYVPIEHTDRLSRYLGGGQPTVQRLHGAAWWRITQKVKTETAALAAELIKIYAAREQCHLAPWQNYANEAVLANTFPWTLTADQLKTWQDIEADLNRGQPMDRLVCGDVGFGKTELAVRAAYKAVLNGYQVAVLSPTTILAQQHFDTFNQRLKNLGVQIGLLNRAQLPACVRQTKLQTSDGSLDILIGTHAVLADDVKFKKLGLLIVDEEQRFGVKQKDQLKKLRPALHVLSLSATPIPRTLNLSLSNLRDLSIIATPPAGRQAVKTICQTSNDETVHQAITTELKRGGQIFYLVNRIKDLPATEYKIKKLLPQLTLGIIHGRRPAKLVADVMHRFDQGELKLLLATSMIEHGLDLPNVNTLVVEKAELFGLADLYQLRGRVGRGTTQAYAYFLLGDSPTELAKQRLNSLLEFDNLGSGLSLALKDLELRGAGAILGKKQHGHVTAVGLHLYGQLLQEAITEQKNHQALPAVPEVLIRLPLEARLTSQLVPNEINRINLYQKLAAVREPSELRPLAETLLGRALQLDNKSDQLLNNLLTTLTIKLLAEKARLREVSCQVKESSGQFTLRWLEPPTLNSRQRLIDFDPHWRTIANGWQAWQPLAAGAWIPWLKQSLKKLTD